MIRMMLFILLAASIGWGDTINSTAKNPSMLAYGTQNAPSTIISQTCPYWTGDLNNAPGNAGTTNCLNGYGGGLGNAPTGDWYFVDTKYHANGIQWATQTAVGMTIAGADNTYVRNRYNWSWTAWVKVGSGSGGLGVGQTWANVTASRALGGVYANWTGKPIEIAVSLYSNGFNNLPAIVLYINGVATQIGGNYGLQTYAFLTAVIPNGSTYQVVSSGTGDYSISRWFELR